MKKRISLVICLLLIALCACALADVAIDGRNFPDSIFREYVQRFDKDGNGSFDEEELYDVFDMDISGMGISSLKGIEYFGALTSLDAFGNKLTEVDVSNNPLSYLHLQNNQLRTLDVSENTFLTTLYCDDNHLTSLTLGNLVTLDSFCCRNNSLKTIDVSGCPKLEKLMKTSKPGYFEPEERNYFGWFLPQPSEGWPNMCLFVDKGIKIVTSSGTVDTSTLGDSVPVTSITLNKTKITLTRTANDTKPTYQLIAIVAPENADDVSVKWTSSNPKVAKVDQNGKVTAVKKGTAVITCEAKDGSGVKATCKVTVKNKLITKITLNKTKATLAKGKTLQLKVKAIKPADAFNQKVKWSTSNKKVATVDKNGKVKAIGKGSCVITCAATDGSGIKATCKITVK